MTARVSRRYLRFHALATRSLLVCALLDPSAASAQDDRAIGDADDAMPGYARTHVASERPVGFAVNGTAGYGFTESVPGAPGPHQRAAMSLAASANPLPWLGLALRYDGRGDFHPDDGMGKDRGFVASGSFALRLATRLENGLGFGGQLSLLTRGGTSSSFGWDGLSVEATGLVSYRQGGFSLAAEVGFRADRSARALPQGVTFRPGDTLSLGVSDFHAVLARLGAGYRHETLEIFGDVAWDVLVGDGAPSVARGPLHVALGGRLHPSDAIQLEAVVDVCASSRGAVGNGDTVPYYVIDPRLTVRVGVTYRFGVDAVAETADAETDTEPSETTPEATAPVAPPVPGARSLRGVVYDDQGAPLVDAHLVVRVGDTERDAYSDGQGAFVIENIPQGDARLVITATHHVTQTLALGAGELALPEGSVRLVQAAPAGVIRGLVRNFDGTPLRATIRLRPGNASATAAEDGTFQLEVAPGRYTVTVEAQGFRAQSRQVELTDGQVTILNVDLRQD